MNKIQAITPEEFDAKVEAGEDIDPYLDWSKAKRPGLELHTVSLDCPEWMVQALDKAAKKRGITRQSLIKVILTQAIESEMPDKSTF